ncbi:MAG: nitronate monooxygenase family protein [Deltaproteobacteria bacterium]|nr:nitronate monooxygenase family protein [Deltaproteobacteria bacterium]
MTLRTPICERFGIEHPVFLAGMGEVAFAELVAAVSEAGGYGVLGMATSPPERIREQMRAVRARTARPFGVDMLAALPELVEAAIDVIVEEGASCFVAGLGVPAPVIARCHAAGVQVMVVCGKVDHARRAEDAGCDAVVAQGTEAGGHTGQIAGMALVPQIVDAVGIPVLAAGAIVDGRGLAAALALGAQGVWMGTRFIATREARAAKLYKERLVAARDDGTEITRSYSGKPMRVLRNAWVDEWRARGSDIQPFPLQMAAAARAGALGFADDATADPERTCMPAGQGAGAIHDVPAAGDLVRSVVAEAERVLRRIGALAEAGAPGS